MSDFVRVNGPRVEKILKQIDNIEKSARSYRVSVDERQALLKPLHDWFETEIPDQSAKIAKAQPKLPVGRPAQIVPVEPEISKHVANRLPAIVGTDTQTLIDFALAAAVEIAKRRK